MEGVVVVVVAKEEWEVINQPIVHEEKGFRWQE